MPTTYKTHDEAHTVAQTNANYSGKEHAVYCDTQGQWHAEPCNSGLEADVHWSGACFERVKRQPPRFDPHNGADIADFVGRAFNIMGKGPQRDALALLLNEHRTIQQSIAEFYCAYLSGLAAAHEEGRSDLRNQHACEMAAQAKKAWGRPVKIGDFPSI